ncbi:FAD binding domain of DNA photolyase-domain-containing protein, partial [Lineolata rhizophorae]
RPRVLYWFRTDLRLHDSPALHAALELDPECFCPVFTWDPHYVYRTRAGPNRWQFLIDSLTHLSHALTALHPSQTLLVLRGPPLALLAALLAAHRITHLAFEPDPDPRAAARDARVRALAQARGVALVNGDRPGRTLWDPAALVAANAGRPTTSLAQLRRAAAALAAAAEPPRPLARPERLPPPPPERPSPADLERADPDVAAGRAPDEGLGADVNAALRARPERSYAGGAAGPRADFAVPALEELGFAAGAATTPLRGGEGEALARLGAVAGDAAFAARFAKPATAPTALGFGPEENGTTGLSPYLHFGCLGVREFWWRVQGVVEEYEGRGKREGGGAAKATRPPESLAGQLLFREMYFAAQAALGERFGRTVGNDIVRFVPWHLPSKLAGPNGDGSGLAPADAPGPDDDADAYRVDSPQAHAWFRRWRAGTTGFPWIDALMRQLRRDGWVHHLGRHALACFLTRGGCYVDWERGARVFEELLLDHEPACNAGNWMWLSCTAFESRFFRCYSPVAFPKRWDREGRFVKRWVPELGGFPERFVYEPWNAPAEVQRKAGCAIRGDGLSPVEDDAGDGLQSYPEPMFDFAERRDVCIRAMKKAYRVGLFGNDERVLDGSWRRLFDDEAEGPTEGE